jgi:hypothetical protein
VRNEMTFHLASRVEDVLKFALEVEDAAAIKAA